MKPAITDITGIGPAAAAALAKHGFESVKALASTTTEKLSEVPGFSNARAQKVIAAAAEMLGSTKKEPTPPDEALTQRKEMKKKGKKKDKKKDKKSKKDKKNKKGKKRKNK